MKRCGTNDCESQNLGLISFGLLLDCCNNDYCNISTKTYYSFNLILLLQSFILFFYF